MPSVRENILGNLKTTIEGIAPGGTPAAGYTTPIKQVFRWGMDGALLQDSPVVVLGDVNETYTQNSLQLLHRTMTVVLEGWHRVEFDADDTVGGVVTAFIADLEKALMVDVSRGGYASDTILKSNEAFVEAAGSPYLLVSVTAEIKYRSKLTDPASLTP